MKRITAVICAILSLSMLCSCQTLFETVAESNRQETSSFVESVESEELNNDRIELLDLDRDEIHPKIWKVESKDGKGGKLYLFGSIHIGVEEMFPLDDRIESAYEDSDAVAVEVDVISMEYGVNNLAEQYQKYLMYNDGTSLLNHISPETYSAVGQYLKKNHVSIYPYIGYKPYVLSEIVSSVKQKNSDKTAPYSSDYGIDRHYLTRAKLDGKQVLEVEDSKERLKMYGDYSDNVQEWSLLSALLSDTENFDGSIELLKQWTSGRFDRTCRKQRLQ